VSLQPCMDCGAPTTETRCPLHTTARDRSTQRRFARIVLGNAGHRCQYIERGARCTVTTELQAHHTQPGNNDPSVGVALCTPHHQLLHGTHQNVGVGGHLRLVNAKGPSVTLEGRKLSAEVWGSRSNLGVR
jgi:hypothetical protein